MELKIGEVAKRSGLSVRTLHHYDAIGLLSPLIRTEGCARVYGRQDLRRLHRIQALKRFGYSLSDIRSALDDANIGSVEIIDRQVRLLEAQAQRARDLIDKLEYVSKILADEKSVELVDWLTVLEMMTIYERTLTEEELRILRSPTLNTTQAIEAERALLISEARDCMRTDVRLDSPRVRTLAWRWVHMVIALTSNNAALAGKLKTLQEQDTRAQEIVGIDAAMLKWIGHAIVYARLSLFGKYLSPAQAETLRRRQLDHWEEWPILVALVREQMEAGTNHDAPAMRLLAFRWRRLFRDSYFGDDEKLEINVRNAISKEPDLSLGVGVDKALLIYVHAATSAIAAPVEK